MVEKYMNYIQTLRDKGHFISGEPLEETGKILSGERGRKWQKTARLRNRKKPWADIF